ncbi:ATP-binding protein [Flavobacterium sp. RHBU_3]|uniref:ATP-binding protein n=1 Tax=Flavobacterium sp. RHBU_3 TaxID=3391184 RepID=UPI003984BEB1
MKIRTKLQLALGTLFLLIAILSAFAIRQVNLLAQDTKNILVANYQSLDYSRNMLKAIDADTLTANNLKQFKFYMDKQVANITEVGEKEYTTDLQMHYASLVKEPTNKTHLHNIRESLNSVMKLNMDAIQRKSAIAEKTADSSVLWLTFTAALCISLGFLLFINLPTAIAAPIKKLTESIRQIAEKNYSQRVYIQGHDEFATMATTFNSMAQKLEEYSASDLAKLMTEKKRVETLINNMADPVIGLDETHHILFVNEEALKITALKKESVIGRNISEVALTNDLVRDLSREAVLGETQNRQVMKIYADGRESYFEKNIIPIQVVPTGETASYTIGSVIILRNITAHKELDEAKTNFIATVSHEFKTPIASMKMSLQLLENEKTGTLNNDQKELLASIKDDTARLLRTTGELLNITQVETGKTALNLESCNVAILIEDAVDANRIQASGKHTDIKVQIAENLKDILADREKTTWIISNLISNAVRYSYENAEITVSAATYADTISISVKDNGIGISEHYIGKIFDKYFRVPGSQKEGTGLGLAISKEFMEAQGGTITVSSTPGQGSIFTLVFKQDF